MAAARRAMTPSARVLRTCVCAHTSERVSVSERERETERDREREEEEEEEGEGEGEGESTRYDERPK